MDWIDINEQQPQDGDVVLVKCQQAEYVVAARYMRAEFYDYGAYGNGEKIQKDVTEWTPAPLVN